MGIRFRKSVSIAPGIKVNVGKKSAGISIGGKFGGVSVNSKTGVRTRTSVPGTGISYTKKLGSSSRKANKSDSKYSESTFIPSGLEDETSESNHIKEMIGRILLGIAAACSIVGVILAILWL